MAIISCPECGKEISSAAEKCPYCGKPMKSLKKKSRWLLLVIVVCLIVGVSVAVSYTHLDVYKRQGDGRRPAQRLRLCGQRAGQHGLWGTQRKRRLDGSAHRVAGHLGGWDLSLIHI